MVEVSHLFDWSRTPLFLTKWGKSFDVASMNGASNFQLVVASYSPSDIEDCLDANGTLNNDVTVAQAIDCGLKWQDDVIKLNADVTWSIGDSIVPLKALFLRDKNSGFVLGYSINNTSFEVTNQLKFNKDTIFWSIING